RELERAGRSDAGAPGFDVDRLVSAAVELDGARVLVSAVPVHDPKQLLELADRLKGKLGDAVIVLAGAGEDRVDLVATVAPSLRVCGQRSDRRARDADRAGAPADVAAGDGSAAKPRQ